MLYLVLSLIVQVINVLANTEKVIFLGPSPLEVPVEHPTLEDLQLASLSPHHWSWKTHIRAEFPTDVFEKGESTWILLHELQEGQRYEVRVCWAATQPTSFRLDTYDLPTVFQTPDLITSLARYSEIGPSGASGLEDQVPRISTTSLKTKRAHDDVISTLFLHIQAAADYYTMNQTIMEQVPPVFVDIILDPYVLNVLPRSLIPTVAYIVLLAIGSWYLSGHINRWVQFLVKDDVNIGKKES